MKKIQKQIKKGYQLAFDPYDTGIYDAMHLAGLIADDAKMTMAGLQRWVDKANGTALCGSTVARVAAGSQHCREIALTHGNFKRYPLLSDAAMATCLPSGLQARL
jgi:hypothetical protein